MINVTQLAELLKKHDNYILTTHVNPDADAIGSVVALQRALVENRKTVRIINCSETPRYLQFLDGDQVVEHYNPDLHDEAIRNAGAFIALDFNRVDRMIKMAHLFKDIKGVKICIDHHQGPEEVFDYVFSDTLSCATGHILFDFIKHSGFAKLSYRLAEPIYAAIMTDTGSFCFDRTTADVFRIAAELVEAGVVPMEIFTKIYSNNTAGKLLLLGTALESIQYRGQDKQVGVMTVTQGALKKTGTKEDETDQFVNMIMSVGTVKIGMKFLELPQGFKLSLRSKGSIPIHEFASAYGGGGHRNASGIRIRDKVMADVKEEMIAAALTFLEKWETNQHV